MMRASSFEQLPRNWFLTEVQQLGQTLRAWNSKTKHNTCPAMVARRSSAGKAAAAMHATSQQHNPNKILNESKQQHVTEAMDLCAAGDAAAVEHEELELYGVVEGFYGRPWSWGQRRKLFHMLSDFGLNCYMYAPKDDLKHRAYWKTMYTPEECTLLRRMIEDAVAAGVVFVYALSPGVDITYSNRDDIETMRRKLTQIAQLGCKAFALLFDDLDPPQLREVDAKQFKNFAEAQCAVANVMYEHLGKPQNFLFCPTEYCATRAVPSVRESEYLRTCGQMLPKPIHILWTGPNVISRFLTAESLTELEQVIGRKCTIWDNLHANDYDRQRIYLGPYDRDPQEVLPHVRGILLNPNCEFGANYLPIHTFHTWCNSQQKSNHASRHASGMSQRSGTHAASSFSTSSTPFVLANAVESAISWWTAEWNVSQDAYGNALGSSSSNSAPFSPVSIPMIDAETINTPSSEVGNDDQEMRSTSTELTTTINDSAISGSNSNLIAGNLVQIDDIRVLVDLFYLPFQYGQIASELVEDFRWLRLNAAKRRRMLSQQSRQQHNSGTHAANHHVQPLPVEWEQRMQRFESHYSRVNRMCRNLARCGNRALLHELYPYFWDLNYLLAIIRSYLKWLMTATQDEATSSDAGSDAAATSGDGKSNSSQWPQQGSRNEPWYNRGGLFGEFQRLLPLDVRSSDLFSCIPADPHTEKIYSIRPYFESSDRLAIFELCAAALRSYEAARQLLVDVEVPISASNTMNAAIYERSSALTSNLMLHSTRSRTFPHVMTVGDALLSNSVIGAYLNMSPSRLICFVNCSEQQQHHQQSTMNDSGEVEMICGYVMAAPEARAFRVNAKPWFQITASSYIRALQGVPVDLSQKGGAAASAQQGWISNSDTTAQTSSTASSTDISDITDNSYKNFVNEKTSLVAHRLAQTFENLCCGPDLQQQQQHLSGGNENNSKSSFPAEFYQQYPSVMTLSVSDHDDVSAANALKRLLTCALAALKSKGSTGVHAVLNKYNMHLKVVYQRYNFVELERRRVDIHKPSRRFTDELRRVSLNNNMSGSVPFESVSDGSLTDVESMELLVLGRSI